jgi:hypothetical protein
MLPPQKPKGEVACLWPSSVILRGHPTRQADCSSGCRRQLQANDLAAFYRFALDEPNSDFGEDRD